MVYGFTVTNIKSRLVYFIACGPFIKIGITNDLVRRLQSLEAQCPYPLTVLGVIAGSRRLEKALHLMFVEDKHRSEWFRATKQLHGYIHDHADSPDAFLQSETRRNARSIYWRHLDSFDLRAATTTSDPWS